MDLSYPTEAEEFRVEIRAWLESNLPAGWFDDGFEMSADERAEFNRTWPTKLFEGGWICATWPTEYGGGGMSELEQVILAEEFEKAGAPTGAGNDAFSIQMVGNTILHWGTEEQKAHFLPRIISGEDVWCQGYSEPDAGSDLGGLGCKAVLDGDEWVINGQKIWTSGAHYSDFGCVVVRTDPNVPKHKGLSYFFIDMKSPGIEIKPIKQLTGESDFNEVYFTDVRVPDSQRWGHH